MNVLFLSISTAISDINNRGIYPDLLRYFANQSHNVYIVCPFERRTKKDTGLSISGNVSVLGVKTLNITKSNPVEKLLATLTIEKQFDSAIRNYLGNVKFDLILYTTPPITFNSLISKLKRKHNAKTYLMLKDIFPQNAVDLGYIRKGLIFRYFRKKEKELYRVSDTIGCMSPANVSFVLKHNPEISATKVSLCPNAIEVRNRKLTSGRETVFGKFNIPKDACVFLYGGNLGVAQGIPFLIKLLEACKDRKDVFFVIVGSGNRSKLISDFISRNKPQNAVYLPMLPRAEYEFFELSSDVGMVFLDGRFTIPNFPSRMLSYMEASLPLLITSDANTDSGTIAEKNGYGKWCEFGNLDYLLELINFFVDNPEKRAQMGRNGFQFLSNNYTVENSYKEIISKVAVL